MDIKKIEEGPKALEGFISTWIETKQSGENVDDDDLLQKLFESGGVSILSAIHDSISGYVKSRIITASQIQAKIIIFLHNKGFSVSQLSDQFGMKPQSISNILQIKDYADEMKPEISLSSYMAVASLPEDQRNEVLAMAVSEGMSSGDVRNKVASIKNGVPVEIVEIRNRLSEFSFWLSVEWPNVDNGSLSYVKNIFTNCERVLSKHGD